MKPSPRSKLSVARDVFVLQHGADRLDVDAGRSHVANDPGQPSVPFGSRVGTDQQFLVVGILRVGGPHLGAADDDVIAVDPPTGLERGEVGAGARLGKPLTPQRLAGQDAGQVEGFLFLGAARDQGWPRMHHRDVCGVDVMRRTRARQLFVPDDLTQSQQAEPAVLLGPGNAGPPVIMELALPIAVELRRC
ncbi:MAG: hypothetical protein JF595_16600 [Sphingomonadales bacterium]|nr:hypothetical protein [Sphingomonadales bacterium]